MSNRRQFLGTITGAAAGLVANRPAAAFQQPRRREVTLGGRRVKTVDFHAHTIVPEAAILMGRKISPQDPLIIGPERLRRMDQQGIDIEALSINPYWYALDRDLAARFIQVQNEKLAEMCAAHPDRFLGLATVALQHPDLAAEQLEAGIRLGLRGASMGASVNGEELGSPRFDPFWSKAQELGVPIFMHPQGAPELQKRLQGNGMLTNVIGNPLDTTIALSHLIFEGTLDRFPELKICAAHGGGYLPSYADRSDHGCVTFPNSCNRTPLKKHPTEYLRQLYFDSLIFTPEALRHLIAECGISQVVMGTDDPFPWTGTAVDHILGSSGLSDSDRAAILGGNASRLLGISG